MLSHICTRHLWNWLWVLFLFVIKQLNLIKYKAMGDSHNGFDTIYVERGKVVVDRTINNVESSRKF